MIGDDMDAVEAITADVAGVLTRELGMVGVSAALGQINGG
jgi:hypothetical protein